MSSLCDDMSDCHDGTDEKNCPLKPGRCGDDVVVCLTVANGRLYFSSCFKILCERDSDPLKDFFLNQCDMYIHH